jgi:serine protease Do
MSSRVAENVIDQLQRFGETRRGWLGVRIQDVSEDVAEAIGLEEVRGALVTDVPEGPSAEAGMQSGDVILSFDGMDVNDTRELVQRVANTEIGKEVRVVVFRDGGTQTLTVVLGRREEAEAIPASAPAAEPAEEEILGLTVSAMTDELREQLGLPAGSEGLVVRDVAADSEAFEKGLRAGDVIAEAGQQAITTPAELEERIAAARDAGRKSLLLLVRREGEPRFVALSLEQG